MRRPALVRSGRRRWLAGIAGLLLAPWSYRRASAADVDVPISLQIELMSKVVKYDRNAAARMKDGCRLLLVRSADDSESSQAAAQAKAELAKLADIAGAAIGVTEHEYVDAKTLAQKCDDHGASIVMLTPGLSDHVSAIAGACVDRDLLTVSLIGRDVYAGIVLGFALEESRPTIVVHLGQARKQHVDFSARLLAIAKVIE